MADKESAFEREMRALGYRNFQQEQAGPPVIPPNLAGLADGAFAMADRGEDPSDMLAMLQAGLKKAQPQWSEQKTRIVNAMCMTWRHDFGLDKRHGPFGYSGMTEDERDALRQKMGQLYEHHIAPVIDKNERLADAVNSAMHSACMPVDADPVGLADAIHKLQVKAANEHQAARYWKKRFDEDTTEAIDLLKAELERARAENESLKGSCKALGKENTALARRLKKAERALSWFPENIGFLKPKWLQAVLDGLRREHAAMGKAGDA